MSDGLSHVDAEGRPRMVDVGDKAVTRREACAEARVVQSPKPCGYNICARPRAR